MSDPVPVPIAYEGEVHRVEKAMIFCLALPLNQVADSASQVLLDSPLPRCRVCYPEADVVEVGLTEEPAVEPVVQQPAATVTCPFCDMQTSALERFCSHCSRPTSQTPD